MATLDDLVVPSNEFVEVYATTGATVGTELELQLKTTWPVIVQEVGAKPANESVKGRVMSVRENGINVLSILSGSGTVWVRCAHEGSVAILSVESL